MKKLAIGCAIVLVLGSAAVVGVVYYGYLKVKSTVTQLAELSKIPEIERDVRVKAAFSVPVSGELTSAEVDKFMQVTTRVRDRLGKNFDTIERTYKSLADKKGNTTVADLPALMSAYRDIAAAWLDAKRTQVAALNDVGLSLDEYRWIRSSSYAALGCKQRLDPAERAPGNGEPRLVDVRKRRQIVESRELILELVRLVLADHHPVRGGIAARLTLVRDRVADVLTL